MTGTEQWRPVVGYEGLYEASDEGRVRSLDRYVYRSDGRRNRIAGRVLKPTINSYGHMYIALSRDNKRLGQPVQRLVLSAFGVQGSGDAKHRNGDVTDNRLANLVWESNISPLARMWEKTQVSAESECWLYTGSLVDGYPSVRHEGRTVIGSRLAYKMLVNPNISDELVVDHVAARGCISRSCWNPTHLEEVTNYENIRRGTSPSAPYMKAAS